MDYIRGYLHNHFVGEVCRNCGGKRFVRSFKSVFRNGVIHKIKKEKCFKCKGTGKENG